MKLRAAAPLAFFALATLMPLAAAAQEPTIREVFKRVAGSVVVIRTEEKTLTQWSGGEMVSVGGLGSGVLISEDGKILTAAHVVQAAAQIIVEFPSGEIVRAVPVASVPSADVALIQLERAPRSQLVVAKVVGASAAIDLVLHVILVPRLGILGAAIATSTTMVLWNGALVFFVFRRMRLDPTALSLLSRRNWRPEPKP